MTDRLYDIAQANRDRIPEAMAEAGAVPVMRSLPVYQTVRGVVLEYPVLRGQPVQAWQRDWHGTMEFLFKIGPVVFECVEDEVCRQLDDEGIRRRTIEQTRGILDEATKRRRRR